MVLTWDETDGWIFSDEYHDWQDEDVWPGSYRYVSAIEHTGWYLGLYEIKEDPVETFIGSTAAAKWPTPRGSDDLDRQETTEGSW